jgi:hypothetical protein
MSTSQNLKVKWKNVPTRTITAGGVEFAYRELGPNNPGTPVVFLVHLAAVLDNWDPRVVDGQAAFVARLLSDPARVAPSALLFTIAARFWMRFGKGNGSCVKRRRCKERGRRAGPSRLPTSPR